MKQSRDWGIHSHGGSKLGSKRKVTKVDSETPATGGGCGGGKVDSSAGNVADAGDVGHDQVPAAGGVENKAPALAPAAGDVENKEVVFELGYRLLG